MSTFTVEMTTDNFNDLISKNDVVFVDFWASWCGPCKTFGPIFEKVAEAHPETKFAKVGTEAQQELAGAFGIRSIPTLGVFREGVLLYLQPGLVPEEALEDLLTQVKGLDMEQVKKEIEEHEKAHAEHGHECHGCGKH